MAEAVELTVARLGAQGDGVCESALGPVYVPFTLPGEMVRATVEGDRGRLAEIVVASSDRVEPVCPHFTRCGGCVAQHLSHAAYIAWKTEQVRIAFSQRGLAVEPSPVVAVGPRQRRRATLAALRTSRGVLIGFRAAASHDIVDIAACPVLVQEIESALPGLRPLVEPLLSRHGELRLMVTACDNGIDLSVEDTAKQLDAGLRATLADAAARGRVLRLTVNDEPVYERAPPVLGFGTATVVPPPGVFLQASRLAAARMTDIILSALPKRPRRIADLFCGVGTFTFPLAARAEVLAIDGDADAVAALQHAIRHATKLKPIAARVRDLFREPLSRKELDGVDVAVLDPPRAGAKAQCEMLAKAKVPTIVMVSCAPATLARDVRILVDSGYCLESVTPVDQFVFSAHVEAIAVLRR